MSLGLKVTPDLKTRLDTAARENGRTQSLEAEFRLQRSFADDAAFSSPEVRSWAIFLAGVFHQKGSLTAAEKGHPEWTDKEWMQNGDCHRSAVFEACSSLMRDMLRHPEADTNEIGLRIEALKSQYLTHLANTGVVKFKFDGDDDAR